MNRPRVGLDARLTRQMSTGMRAYATELARRLPRVAPDIEFVAFSDGANFGWNEQIVLPLRLARSRLDLSHFLSLYTPAIAPRPYVLTIHDLIHVRFPRHFKAKVGPYYRSVVRFACARAQVVITDDERTVRDLERYLGVPPTRVRVIPLGVNDRFLTAIEPFAAPRPYVLYSGNHRRHKDLPTLFAAWASLPARLAVDLYLTGFDDLQFDRHAHRRPEGDVVFLGDVSAEALAGYYAGALALVHPALAEGFGLPLLEAMAARCPVVASEESVPRVLRGAALTFPAGDAQAAAEAVARLLTDTGLRERLTEEGRAKAQQLTWDQCARATAALYREILEIGS